MNFKVGDIVKGKVNNGSLLASQYATMKIIDFGIGNSLVVEILHHDTMPFNKGLTLTLHKSKVEPILNNHSVDNVSRKRNNSNGYEKVTIYTEDNRVMAIHAETNLESVAYCHPDDKFNFMTGAKLALERLDEMLNPPLYYVKFTNDLMSYLNIWKKTGDISCKDKEETADYKTKFTLDEIKAINPNYLPFAIKVEEDK